MQSTHATQYLVETSPFPFACHDGLPCFTQCCKDVNIYLTPYDVLRLRQVFRIGSSEFLSKYTRSFLAKATNIPVVQLLMDPGTLCCPFVTQEGCQVYENRPWACRMFPLDLSSTDTQFRLITGKERCKGLFERSKGTVGDWLEAQGVLEYAEMDRAFQSVVPARFKPGAPMNEGLGRLLFIAYDLDRFAELIKDGRFATFHDVDEEMLTLAGEDTKELLKLAFRYIRAQMDELYQIL
ncbi:MAG: YkgJ family cysteine cluster protein [Syntrophobacteraceae bacterium]|jgi:Fe-S-cluster containining protein